MERLPGEPAQTDDPVEAGRWVAVYGLLCEWLERMLVERDMAPDTYAVLQRRLLVWQIRLGLWEVRATRVRARPPTLSVVPSESPLPASEV